MEKIKDPYVSNIIRAAKELEEHLSLYHEDFGSLESKLQDYEDIKYAEELDDGSKEMCEMELTIRTKLKEAIEDFEHVYVLI